MNLDELKKKREAQINGIFILMIEIAFIFALPAIGAIILGRTLDQGHTGLYTFILLILAFVISWIITVLIYKHKTQKLQRTEALIKELKKENV